MATGAARVVVPPTVLTVPAPAKATAPDSDTSALKATAAPVATLTLPAKTGEMLNWSVPPATAIEAPGVLVYGAAIVTVPVPLLVTAPELATAPGPAIVPDAACSVA